MDSQRGLELVADAIAAQVSGKYLADAWIPIELKAMTKVWQGVGGESNFFFSEEDARETRGSYTGTSPHRFAETLWRQAQVSPHVDPVSPQESKGFRQEIREFVVDIDTDAAVGICRANVDKGSGTLLQYYLPNWKERLRPTGRVFRFDDKSYRDQPL